MADLTDEELAEAVTYSYMDGGEETAVFRMAREIQRWRSMLTASGAIRKYIEDVSLSPEERLARLETHHAVETTMLYDELRDAQQQLASTESVREEVGILRAEADRLAKEGLDLAAKLSVAQVQLDGVKVALKEMRTLAFERLDERSTTLNDRGWDIVEAAQEWREAWKLRPEAERARAMLDVETVALVELVDRFEAHGRSEIAESRVGVKFNNGNPKVLVHSGMYTREEAVIVAADILVAAAKVPAKSGTVNAEFDRPCSKCGARESAPEWCVFCGPGKGVDYREVIASVKGFQDPDATKDSSGDE